MVCHIGGQLGTKVVISALGMLALYMCFNGTGIWGGETIGAKVSNVQFMAAQLFCRAKANVVTAYFSSKQILLSGQY